LGTAIEGVYTQSHDVRSVDGVETAEDVVEIVRYDPSHIFVDLVAHFDNGHSCSLSGIAAFEGNGSFVYRTRQFLPDTDPTCTLKVAVTRDELRITDRLNPNGPATCRGFCGVRGDLSDLAMARRQRQPVQDVTRVKRSDAFVAAVEEFTRETTGFSATGKINRKDFGLGWNQLLETGDVVVGEELKISFDAEVVAKPE
jgi:hypothetical protein